MEGAVVVLDNGSGFIKAGLHTATEPTCVVPQVIGRPKHRRIASDIREIFIGRRALRMSSVCSLSVPSERGFISSFDDQDLIFEDLFANQLGIDSCDHPVLLSQLPCDQRHQQMQLTAELFERFCIPSLVKKPDCVLSLMDAGQRTGVVMDCGDSVCHSSSIYDGYILLNSIRLLRLGGKDVSECLSRILRCETGFSASSRSAMDYISRIKEALQGLREARFWRRRNCRRNASVHYKLPDGQKIHIKSESVPELYKSGDVLFEPDRQGIMSEGLSDMLLASIANAPSSLHSILTQNVVLCGGSSLFSGLRDRLKHETCRNLGTDVVIHCPVQPQFSAWRGGRILSHLSTFSEMSVTRHEYFEEGPERIEHKFT